MMLVSDMVLLWDAEFRQHLEVGEHWIFSEENTDIDEPISRLYIYDIFPVFCM